LTLADVKLECLCVQLNSQCIVTITVTGRIYRCLFSGSFSSLLTLPLDLLST